MTDRQIISLLKRCMNNPVYRERLEKAGVTPESITSVADIRRIPFTTKQDLRDNYPFGLASVPLTECVRLHSSSGTTGNPTVILHTQKDLDEWANQVGRNLWMVGLRPDDVFQNSSGYGMFTGGLGVTTKWDSKRAARAWDAVKRCPNSFSSAARKISLSILYYNICIDSHLTQNVP